MFDSDMFSARTQTTAWVAGNVSIGWSVSHNSLLSVFILPCWVR